jgi:hypothetical protein|tara:strand:+ start:153 stop:299 length:147 start_codon:yes stop_codon:yes gene_type:complete
MNNYQKLEYIHSAIQEAMNGNNSLLTEAIGFVEDVREKYMEVSDETND